MQRVPGSLLCAMVLVAGACATQDKKPAAGGTPTPQAEKVTGAQTYTIEIDYPSPDGKQYQFSVFYPKSVRVRPGDTGSYHFVCLLHPFMDGTLEVVNEDVDRIRPDAVAKAAVTAYETDETAAGKLPEPQARRETGKTVTAGTGDKVTSVNAFFPASAKVQAGDTVVWKNESPYEPHTVTFQNPFETPEDKRAFVPGGVASGNDFSGGYSHSGLFGPGPVFPSDNFSLKFTKKGSYPYVCILHPGMGGVVDVG